jgi:DNA-binding response OmpR family regulator
MPHHLLIADDEPALLRSLGYALRRQGYEVDAVSDGASALQQARTGEYDLAILDVMMPALNGVEVCRAVRATSELPIILISAKDSVNDVVAGLEAGADDYVRKPFSLPVLLARVAALLRM